MKELGFGNKRAYVMTVEEHDKFVRLLCKLMSDSGFVRTLAHRVVYDGFDVEYDKKLYLEAAASAHEAVRELFYSVLLKQ